MSQLYLIHIKFDTVNWAEPLKEDMVKDLYLPFLAPGMQVGFMFEAIYSIYNRVEPTQSNE